MLWKKFGQAQSASKLFNEAREQWRRRQRFLLEGNEDSARDACVEVIRLCQLAIERDERMGDAYVLLANALTGATSHGSGRSDKERYEFIQSRAAAVIHLWYTLPHRGYPITKNTVIGERLWTTIFDDISQTKSLSENATMALIESYKDSLAIETISTNGFKIIKSTILGMASTLETKQWQQETLEETLTPETLHFLTKIIPEVILREPNKEQVPSGRLSYILAEGGKLVDSLKYEGKITLANIEILERIQQAFRNNYFQEVIGWMGWLFLLQELTEKVTLNSDLKEKSMAEQGKSFGEMLNTAVLRAREAENYNGLIMAIGLCDYIGLPEKGNEILQFLYERIGKNGFESRLEEIKRRPHMLIENSLVNRIQRYLTKA